MKKTEKFVKKHSNNIVTFAILKTEGKDIPQNSNIIERLIKEIQKRYKHKWMQWTTQGQEPIPNLILTRYTNPEKTMKNSKIKKNLKQNTNKNHNIKKNMEKIFTTKKKITKIETQLKNLELKIIIIILLNEIILTLLKIKEIIC